MYTFLDIELSPTQASPSCYYFLINHSTSFSNHFLINKNKIVNNKLSKSLVDVADDTTHGKYDRYKITVVIFGCVHIALIGFCTVPSVFCNSSNPSSISGNGIHFTDHDW